MMRQVVVILLLIGLVPGKIEAENEPLDLISAIKIALENNRDLQYKAHYDLKIATSNYQAALADYRLQSNLTTSASRTGQKTFDSSKTVKKSKGTDYDSSLSWNWKLPTPLGSEFNPFARIDLARTDSEPTEDATTSDKKYTLDLSTGFEWKQPLWPSQVRAGHASLIQAKANYDIARLSYRQVREELILNAITSYYQLISQENQVKLAREELKLTRDLLALSQARLEADQIARLDLMQVKVQASSDEAELIGAENLFKNSKLVFCRLLDLPINSKILIPEETLVEPTIFSSLAGLSKEAAFEESLKDRIDLKGQQINIDLAGLSLDISESENKPALTFAGNHKWKNDKKKLEDIDREMDREWEVSAVLNFPLLDGGLTRENVKAAKLTLKKAKYDYEELLRSIRDEIDQLFEDIQAEKRRLDILNLNLRLAEESSKITKLKYQQGMETANEVLRSQILLFQMKNSINEAMIALFINKAKLLKTMGRLEKRV